MPNYIVQTMAQNTQKKITLKLLSHQVELVSAANVLEDTPKLKLGAHHGRVRSIRNNVGMLSDIPGSGKSIVALSICERTTIQSRASRAATTNLYEGKTGMVLEVGTNSIRLSSSVIVVSKDLVKQWGSYISTQTRLKYCVINNESAVEKFRTRIATAFSSSASNASNTDELPPCEYTDCVIIVGHTTYNAFAAAAESSVRAESESYSDVSGSATPTPLPLFFTRVFFDEVDSLKIPNSLRISAGMYWFISSNTLNLRNGTTQNRGFIKSILTDVSNVNAKLGPGGDVFDHIQLITEEKFLEQSLGILTPIYNTVQFMDVEQIVRKFDNNESARLFFMRIINGDIEGALNVYGVVPYTNVNYFVNDIYTEKLKLKLEHSNASSKSKSSQKKLSVFIKSEKTAGAGSSLIRSSGNGIRVKMSVPTENMPPIIDEELLDDVYSTAMAPSCSISMENIECRCVLPCCYNLFDLKTVMTWFLETGRPTCPMCRASVEFSSMKVLHPFAEKKPIARAPEKAESFGNTLARIFQGHETTRANTPLIDLDDFNRNRPKVLIFVNSDTSFVDITGVLAKMKCEHITNCLYKFECERKYPVSVNKCLASFKSGTRNILVCDQRKFNTGFNITETTHMILYDTFEDEQIKKQVIGRAQRIGRTSALNIYDFIPK